MAVGKSGFSQDTGLLLNFHPSPLPSAHLAQRGLCEARLASQMSCISPWGCKGSQASEGDPRCLSLPLSFSRPHFPSRAIRRSELLLCEALSCFQNLCLGWGRETPRAPSSPSSHHSDPSLLLQAAPGGGRSVATSAAKLSGWRTPPARHIV